MIEKYVCEIYTKPKLDSVNDARLEMFLDTYKPTGEKLISCVKKMDATLLPPCSSVVKEKIKRTNYICSIWNDTTMALPPVFDAEKCGWKLEDGRYRIKWFEGDMSSASISEIAYDEGDQSSSTDDSNDYEDEMLNESDEGSDYEEESDND